VRHRRRCPRRHRSRDVRRRSLPRSRSESSMWRRTLLFLLMMAAGQRWLCARTWAWQVNVDGAASLNDQVHAVTIDSNGDAVAAGVAQNGGDGWGFTGGEGGGGGGGASVRGVGGGG